MRNLILVITSSLAVCASVAAVRAEVIVRETVVRPARTVCTTHVGAAGRVVKVCRTVR